MKQPILNRAAMCTVFLCVACASPPPIATVQPKPGLGEDKSTAIEVCTPAGQRAYLATLKCSDGRRPAYRRTRNVGERTPSPPETEAQALTRLEDRYKPHPPGAPDHHIVDEYELTCGSAKHIIYMDMYHCGVAPTVSPPKGFTIGSPA
jgi:hypothetical protein